MKRPGCNYICCILLHCVGGYMGFEEGKMFGVFIFYFILFFFSFCSVIYLLLADIFSGLCANQCVTTHFSKSLVGSLFFFSFFLLERWGLYSSIFIGCVHNYTADDMVHTHIERVRERETWHHREHIQRWVSGAEKQEVYGRWMEGAIQQQQEKSKEEKQI